MLIKSYGLKGIIKSERINKTFIIVIRDQKKYLGNTLYSAAIRTHDGWKPVPYKIIVLVEIYNPMSIAHKYNMIGSYEVYSRLEALYHFDRIKKNYEQDKTKRAGIHR